MHSSREELEWGLQLLASRWVVSTTPHCRAMELSYVKRHCFYTNLACDDPLWKLLDIINVEEAPIAKDLSMEVSISSSVVEGYSESQLKPLKTLASQKALLNLSPLGKGPSVTLFGRARLSLNDSILMHAVKERVPIPWTSNEFVEKDISFLEKGVSEVQCKNSHSIVKDSSVLHDEKQTLPNTCTSNNFFEQDTSFQEVDVSEVQCKNSSEENKGADASERKCEKSKEVEKQTGKRASSYSPIESSKSFSDNMRKLYRTMNVPVPRPLPSLVDLLNDKKRAKRRSTF